MHGSATSKFAHAASPGMERGDGSMPVLSAAARRCSTHATALLAVLWNLSFSAALRADDYPLPPSGDVRVASGRAIQYTIHFDRNSLRNSLRVGDSLIALTSSETLLRFELPTFHLARAHRCRRSHVRGARRERRAPRRIGRRSCVPDQPPYARPDNLGHAARRGALGRLGQRDGQTRGRSRRYDSSHQKC